MKNYAWLCCLFFIAFFSDCRNTKQNEIQAGQKPLLVLSILPQNYFAQRIGGDSLETIVLAGPGQNPHNYDAGPRQIQELSRASAWVLSGVEFEIMLRSKIQTLFPNLVIVNGLEGFAFRMIEDHDDEDDEHDHSDLEIDRHTWLGLDGAKTMAIAIVNCLCALDESNAQFYLENCDKLLAEMENEFEKLKIDLEPLRGQKVFVYHPSFGYFLDEFGILQEAVETGGKEPTPRQLGALIEKAREEKAHAIFVQAQFPVAAAETVAKAVGTELVSLDPLAENWLENIRIMGEALKKAVAGDSP